MPDQMANTITATMWQDHHSGKRGHQLMTEKLAVAIPAIGANEHVADCDDILAHAKLFSPCSNWTWYITEWDAETGQCFGLVDGLERELGYFDLTELAETTVYGGVPAVERDLYWEPRTLGEIKSGSGGDAPHGAVTDAGAAMTDETGRDIPSPDAASAEEFLFGHAAEPAPGEAVPGGDDGNGAADGIVEPPADDEPTAPAETEPGEELKVVLSIRAGRATIGVQRPSADPHIESFDGPDLYGLADEFPAVVARAQARWEEEPMHPDYVRPAPPARRRNRRQQVAAEAPPSSEEADRQPQPETLRLF